MKTKLLWELSKEDRIGIQLPKRKVPECNLKENIQSSMLRDSDNELPQLSEPQVIRHFIELSTKNHHVDKGFYPLGSCTMKFNPKLNERLAGNPGFINLHPAAPDKLCQGALELMHKLGEAFCKISGHTAITLQPAAGAQGEFAGLSMIRRYHEHMGNPRKKVVMPDSSHGTNPASIVFSGWQPVEIKSGSDGKIDLRALAKHIDEDLAAVMITNPNTLGIFESDIKKVAEMLHSVGAQLYMDGANMNALLGIVRPGDLGIDALHFNLHKTFSTPHGGGGPGAGPVSVAEHLAQFLPQPIVSLSDSGEYKLDWDRPNSMGMLQAFWGSFGVMVKAYAYILSLGCDGLRRVSEDAVLNSNYLLSMLRDYYELPYTETPMHEFVLSGEVVKKYGVKTLDIAKRLLDYGFHAPTIYFPLIVHEALMIEPTETESKETLEEFAEAMIAIKKEAETDAKLLHDAPLNTPIRRLDEVKANRNPILKWKDSLK